MVYRGKPSAGCENCRKAKKRCGLEQPACQRCVKLKKVCAGYRDTTALQIQDESENVKLKAKRLKARSPSSSSRLEHGLPTPRTFVNATTPHSDTTSISEATVDLKQSPIEEDFALATTSQVKEEPRSLDWVANEGPSTFSMKPTADDLATTYFFSQFTAKTGHWTFLRDNAGTFRRTRVLDLAIRACGMAALDNVQPIAKGREYSRALYAEAIAQLNSALRDPFRCRKDESLIAVAMLGYYENLTCDSRESVQSWKAHMNGATQLLKIRGKDQLKTPAGRMLFRETRAQILITCIWEDRHPPEFLRDWEAELEALSPEKHFVQPSDRLTTICFHFAVLRSDMLNKRIANSEAMSRASKIETDMIQWSIDTMTKNPSWSYRDMEVPDSPHVWNRTVHAFALTPAATAWNTYRIVRMMLTRTQGLLCHRLGLSGDDERAQMTYFQKVRREMVEDICKTIPVQLGHAAPALISRSIIVTAYASIWPLFFAVEFAVERIGMDAWAELLRGKTRGISSEVSEAFAQALWGLGRLEYISKHVGLKWADGFIATLKGDFYHVDREAEDFVLQAWGGQTDKSQRSLASSQAMPTSGQHALISRSRVTTENG